MEKFLSTYAGSRVLVTGHTGFKGSWLCEWLLALGAQVRGYSLPPPTEPALFEQLGLAGRLQHEVGDIRDAAKLAAAVHSFRPEFVFHLAAQPLVRCSYKEPVETYSTNVMGTVHLLEALRALNKPCAAVFVTTDKCYENNESGRAYGEDDSLGGHDPYSSSKAASEIAISGYRRSFFSPRKLAGGIVPPVAIASARAGNVIGGGDWALDRIVPDCMRALAAGRSIAVRNPAATRPWQHVLEPLGGYLALAARLREALVGAPSGDADSLEALCSAFNFGPAPESNRSVREVVDEVLRHWPGSWEDCSDPKAPHEATLLCLSIEKARRLLAWQPRWDFRETVARTVLWYRDEGHRGARALASLQISDYSSTAPADSALSTLKP
jgi:CDP-glucose 4,6-dehydratase